MRLEAEELRVLKDNEFLPLKAKVCQKVEVLWADLLPQLRQVVAAYDLGHFSITSSSGKISKGENYRHYAYRVLDFPNALTKDDMFLFRSMMLWGDAFGFHFILAGTYLDAFGEMLMNNRNELPGGIFWACHEDPWIWHSSAEGWKKLVDLNEAELLEERQKRKFLKLSFFLDLGEYQKVEGLAKKLLETYMGILFGKKEPQIK